MKHSQKSATFKHLCPTAKDISTLNLQHCFSQKRTDAQGQRNKVHEYTCQTDSVLNSPQNGMFQIMKGSKHKHYLMLDTH